MAYAWISQNNAQGGSSTSINVLLLGLVSVGDLIVVAFSHYFNGGTITITDNATGGSNTYTIAVAAGYANGARYEAVIAYCVVARTRAVSLTITLSTTVSDFWDVTVMRFSGNDPTAPLDQVNSASMTLNNNSPSTPNITTAIPGELYIGVCTMNGTPGTYTPEAGWTDDAMNGGFNEPTDSVVNVDVEVYGHQSSAPSGTYAATWSTANAHLWSVAIASFKPATGGGGGSLFRHSNLSGLGSCGPHFQDPLGR